MMDKNINMTKGLLLDKYIIPIDEDIINILTKEYNFNEEEIKTNILKNKHNLITTCYYLLLNKKIRGNKKSNCDISSPEFDSYLNDNQNLLEKYDYDIDKICAAKIKKAEKNDEIDKSNEKKNTKFWKQGRNCNKVRKIKRTN